MTNYEPEKITKPAKKRRIKKSNAHIGSRHALYAFIVSLVIQIIISVPILLNSMSAEYATRGGVTEEQALSVFYQPEILFWLQLSSYISWFATGIFVSWRIGLNSIIKDFWFKFRWAQDLTFGILIAVGLRGLEVLLFWLLGDVLKIDLTGADNTSAFLQGTGIWTYLLLIIIVSIIGPLSEEFLFRGMLLQGLIRTFRRKTLTPRTWIGEEIQQSSPKTFGLFVKFKNFLYKHKYVLAVLISSAAFGSMHFQGFETFGQWLVVIETGLIGLVFALIVLRTRRLGLAIIAHMAFNASGVVLALIQ